MIKDLIIFTLCVAAIYVVCEAFNKLEKKLQLPTYSRKNDLLFMGTIIIVLIFLAGAVYSLLQLIVALY